MSKILPFKLLIIFFILSLISCSKESENADSEITVTTTNFSISMNENPEDGQIIGTVSGSTNHGSVTFSLTEESPIGALYIDAATGELKVANGLLFDYEINPIITGTVKVSNGTIFENASVTITLNDTNDVYEGDVFLKTQEEVNTFGANNYTEINGFLVVGDRDETGATNISDLSPLHSIKKINSHFEISRNPNLVSTAGLNVYEIKGQLAFMLNSSLEKIEGFDNLTSILDIIFWRNPLFSCRE